MISRIVALAVAAQLSALAVAAEKEQPIEVYFSPGASSTQAIVRELSNAKQTVHVQAYSFTSQPIARALTDAEKRGVKVIAILHASNRTKNYSAADFLTHEGVETYVDSMHAIAHNKIMIIDGITVLTGSFNFMKAADEKNAQNLLVIRDDKLPRARGELASALSPFGYHAGKRAITSFSDTIFSRLACATKRRGNRFTRCCSR